MLMKDEKPEDITARIGKVTAKCLKKHKAMLEAFSNEPAPIDLMAEFHKKSCAQLKLKDYAKAYALSMRSF